MSAHELSRTVSELASAGAGNILSEIRRSVSSIRSSIDQKHDSSIQDADRLERAPTRLTALDTSPKKKHVPAPFDGVEDGVLDPHDANTSRKHKRRLEHLYLFAMCTCLFLGGWNDSSPGPLLPRLQEAYQLSYIPASMIFVAQAVGFITSAVANVFLTDKLGFGLTITIGSALQIFAYCIQAAGPPFPVFAISYAINGFGEGIQNALACGLVATLPTSPAEKMSVLHGSYGIGALISPLVATQFSHQKRWTFHFLCSLGVACLNFSALLYALRLRRQEALLQALGVQPTVEEDDNQGSKFGQIIRLKTLHTMSAFIFVYVGTEVTIGGWIVTFLLNKRNAGPNAGYVSSGFFGGLALGRFALIWVNKMIGEWRAVVIYGVLCIGLEITVWFVPNLYENAIAVSFVGVCLGPLYPIVMNVASVHIPRKLLTGSIGWIGSIGQTGSAVFPFLLALLAQKYGVQVLQPLIVAMIAFLLVLWLFVPRTTRRED